MSTATVLARTGNAEWTRIWSVRSTWILAAVTALVVVGFSAILGAEVSNDPSYRPSSAWEEGRGTGMFALFGILAMSVVTATADHVTGGIVPTLQWTPRRAVLLTARTGVIAATMTLLGVLLAAAASAMVWMFVPDVGLPASEGAQTLGGLAVVFAGGALLGVGLGLLTRSAAGGLVSALALVLVLPLLLAQFPYEWVVTVAAHLPGSGALYLIFGEGPRDDMTTMSARLTLAAWAAAALTCGGWRLIRADVDR